MAAQTIFSHLITWAQGDRPGAGSQVADSNGINGNWWKVDEKLNVLFYLPSNILRDNIIGPENLKLTVTDDTTLEQDGDTGKVRIKDSGVSSAKIAALAVTGAKLNSDVAGSGLQLVASQLAVKVDNVTLMVGVSGLQIKALSSAYAAIDWADEATLHQDHNGPLLVKDGGIGPTQLAGGAVTAAKMSHDNSARKVVHVVGIPSLVDGAWGQMHGVSMAAGKGLLLQRGGYVTKINGINFTYGQPQFRFEAGTSLYVLISTWSTELYPMVYTSGGQNFTNGYEASLVMTTTGWVVIEAEYDD